MRMAFCGVRQESEPDASGFEFKQFEQKSMIDIVRNYVVLDAEKSFRKFGSLRDKWNPAFGRFRR